jgi:hypothetical protein
MPHDILTFSCTHLGENTEDTLRFVQISGPPPEPSKEHKD